MSRTAVYNLPARWLHWAIFGLIALEFAIAWTMPDIHRDTRPVGLVAWHLGLGTFILSLMLLRLLWRGVSGVPDPHPAPAWQDRIARLTHGLLYAGFIALPLLGWANASARGWTVHWAGWVPLPALAAQGAAWARPLGDVHQIVAYALLGLIALHVLAAVHHHFIVRDGLLRRMWWSSR